MGSPERLSFGLRGKLLFFGLLLVAATTGPGLWSTLTFARLSRVLAEALQDSERLMAATAAVSGALEREDDALLFAFTNDPNARAQLVSRRAAVDDAVRGLAEAVTVSSRDAEITPLHDAIAAYRSAGDTVLATGRLDDRAERYQADVNPLLRAATVVVAGVRDEHIARTEHAGEFARDEARRSVGIALLVSLAGLAFSGLFGFQLARGVVWPLRTLTASVETLRAGNFEERVPVHTHDEIGQLSEGFNRMAADLAEFRRANVSEVLRAKAVLEATLAALPDAIIVIDPTGTIVATNPFAKSILGDVRDAGALAAAPLPAELIEAAREALRGGPADARVDLQKAIPVLATGAPMKLLPRIVPIQNFADSRRGAVLVLNDVTELIRLDEMRMELIAVASHELRTPVTTLRMTLDMLQESAIGRGDFERDLLRTALGGVEQLTSTVDEFLDLTRIEAGELRLSCQRVVIGPLLGEALRATHQQCEAAGIDLVSVIDADLPPVRLDAGRVKIVLANVLSNAMKYTPHGGRVHVGATRVDGGVRIAVTDSGRGVPRELRGRIFEKFFRVEHETSENGGVKGVGIGLYLAREIVQAHGGSIRCEAGDGDQGARIVFELPVAGPPEMGRSATEPRGIANGSRSAAGGTGRG